MTDLRALTARLVDHALAGTTDLAPEPWVTDVGDFLSPERHRREVEQFFRDTPQVIGFGGQVAEPGSYLCTDVVGVPVLVCRDAGGILRAFVNACAHRGARVAEGAGSSRRLTCGFHGWTYALDGTLAGRRHAEDFPPDDGSCSLRPLPIAERAGLLVVGVGRGVTQEAVDAHLDDIAAELEVFGFGSMSTLAERRFDVAADWKLVTGVSCESYHFATLHRDTVARWLLDHAIVDAFGPHCRWAFPLAGIERLADVPRDQWPDEVPGAVSHVLFPGTVVIANGSSAQMIRAEPADEPGRSTVRYLGVHGDPATRDGAVGAYEFGGDAFEREDLVAVVEAQRGLTAAGGTMVVGRNEAPLALMCRTWAARLT